MVRNANMMFWIAVLSLSAVHTTRPHVPSRVQCGIDVLVAEGFARCVG